MAISQLDIAPAALPVHLIDVIDMRGLPELDEDVSHAVGPVVFLEVDAVNLLDGAELTDDMLEVVVLEGLEETEQHDVAAVSELADDNVPQVFEEGEWGVDEAEASQHPGDHDGEAVEVVKERVPGRPIVGSFSAESRISKPGLEAANRGLVLVAEEGVDGGGFGFISIFSISTTRREKLSKLSSFKMLG